MFRGRVVGEEHLAERARRGGGFGRGGVGGAARVVLGRPRVRHRLGARARFGVSADHQHVFVVGVELGGHLDEVEDEVVIRGGVPAEGVIFVRSDDKGSVRDASSRDHARGNTVCTTTRAYRAREEWERAEVEVANAHLMSARLWLTVETSVATKREKWVISGSMPMSAMSFAISSPSSAGSSARAAGMRSLVSEGTAATTAKSAATATSANVERRSAIGIVVRGTCFGYASARGDL